MARKPERQIFRVNMTPEDWQVIRQAEYEREIREHRSFNIPAERAYDRAQAAERRKQERAAARQAKKQPGQVRASFLDNLSPATRTDYERLEDEQRTAFQAGSHQAMMAADARKAAFERAHQREIRRAFSQAQRGQSPPPAKPAKRQRANNDTGNPSWPRDHSQLHAKAARGEHFSVPGSKAKPAKKRGK